MGILDRPPHLNDNYARHVDGHKLFLVRIRIDMEEVEFRTAVVAEGPYGRNDN
jgi:hypothetical protein